MYPIIDNFILKLVAPASNRCFHLSNFHRPSCPPQMMRAGKKGKLPFWLLVP
jgi:hypothetical protein